MHSPSSSPAAGTGSGFITRFRVVRDAECPSEYLPDQGWQWSKVTDAVAEYALQQIRTHTGADLVTVFVFDPLPEKYRLHCALGLFETAPMSDLDFAVRSSLMAESASEGVGAPHLVIERVELHPLTRDSQFTRREGVRAVVRLNLDFSTGNVRYILRPDLVGPVPQSAEKPSTQFVVFLNYRQPQTALLDRLSQYESTVRSWFPYLITHLRAAALQWRYSSRGLDVCSWAAVKFQRAETEEEVGDTIRSVLRAGVALRGNPEQSTAALYILKESADGGMCDAECWEAVGYGATVLKTARRHLSLRNGHSNLYVARVAREGIPYVVNACESGSLLNDTRSLAVLPLPTSRTGWISGVLTVECREQAAFSREEDGVLWGMGGVLGAYLKSRPGTSIRRFLARYVLEQQQQRVRGVDEYLTELGRCVSSNAVALWSRSGERFWRIGATERWRELESLREKGLTAWLCDRPSVGALYIYDVVSAQQYKAAAYEFCASKVTGGFSPLKQRFLRPGEEGLCDLNQETVDRFGLLPGLAMRIEPSGGPPGVIWMKGIMSSFAVPSVAAVEELICAAPCFSGFLQGPQSRGSGSALVLSRANELGIGGDGFFVADVAKGLVVVDADPDRAWKTALERCPNGNYTCGRVRDLAAGLPIGDPTYLAVVS